MTNSTRSEDVVDPKVRASINSLVSALREGASISRDDSRRLGDDALYVLRDINKCIKSYDHGRNRMDVARCLAEADFVIQDLTQVIVLWAHSAMDDTHMFEIALTCYELLTYLTWPIEKDKETMTNNHHRHFPVLDLAQLKYKHHILSFGGAKILHAAVRIALPSMVPPAAKRTRRDVNIIALILSFLRNVAMMNCPAGIETGIEEPRVSRSAIIDAFSAQDILFTLLTFASNISEGCKTEGIIIVETLFHLIKRVDVDRLFVQHDQFKKSAAGDLATAMRKEASQSRSRNRWARTRHSHFGTEFRIHRHDGKVSYLPSLAAFADVSAQGRLLDDSKMFRPTRRAARETMEPTHLGPEVKLTAHANQVLCKFVRDFLDCGFNPLFQHVRRALVRADGDDMRQHSQWFFYTVAWFLKAERARQEVDKGKVLPSDEVSRFELVAGALNQEMFAALKRSLHSSFMNHDWRGLNAAMRCFTQILLTMQEMLASEVEEDHQIASNALSILFRDDVTRDTIVDIVKKYKDQGFDYLDSCTELAHIYTRVLEVHSKHNAVTVCSTTRTTEKAKAIASGSRDKQVTKGKKKTDGFVMDSAAGDCTAQGRMLSSQTLAGKLALQAVVDTFVTFTKYYSDLNEEQLKRAHRYFYRIAFKQEMSVVLFRVDIIHLFYHMIKGPEPLDEACRMYTDWEELVKQILRRCVKKIQKRPALVVELLFSKINHTAHYLETGAD